MYDWGEDIYKVGGAIDCEKLPGLTDEEAFELMYRSATILAEANGLDYYEVETIEEAADIEYSDFNGGGATLWAIPKNTDLYDLLIDWHKGEDNLLAATTGSFVDEDFTNFYFMTGCGYDIFSADLLGGSADGIARKEFDKFVEERMS